MTVLKTLGIDAPSVMGILNVTPDSFSDGGRFATVEAAVAQARAMVDAGAAIIDVGGESTRPGADAVSADQEIDRVIPVIEAISQQLDVRVSIDTSKPEVMTAAVRSGAALINDVRALREPGALAAAASLQVPVCLMHMLGEPRTMQIAPEYDDVVAEVTQFLADRVAECEQAGLKRDLLLIDPGFGFGKLPDHNIALLANLGELAQTGCPVLLGVSRKSTLGEITGRDVDERVSASVAAAAIGVAEGAAIVRAHDVAETMDAIKIGAAIRAAKR